MAVKGCRVTLTKAYIYLFATRGGKIGAQKACQVSEIISGFFFGTPRLQQAKNRLWSWERDLPQSQRRGKYIWQPACANCTVQNVEGTK